MEGPTISGPKIWLDLNQKGEGKTLDLIKKNNDRFDWLDQYVEECKKKLGFDIPQEPSFVPKVSLVLSKLILKNSGMEVWFTNCGLGWLFYLNKSYFSNNRL